MCKSRRNNGLVLQSLAAWDIVSFFASGYKRDFSASEVQNVQSELLL